MQNRNLRMGMSLFAALGVLALGPNAWAGGKGIQFEEDLRFGGMDHEDEHYEWMDGQFTCFFDVDARGHIVVADIRGVRMLEFDGEGNFVKLLAKQGQGPGEYQMVLNFQFLDDGRAIGVELRGQASALHYYDPGTQFVKTELIEGGMPVISRFSPDGKYAYAWKFHFDGQSLNTISAITDGKFKILKELDQRPWPIPTPDVINDRGKLIHMIAEQFKGFNEVNKRYASFLANGQTLLVDNVERRLEVWDEGAGKKLRAVNHKFNPKPFDEEQREAFVSSLEEMIFNQGGPQAAQIVTPQVLKEAVEKADLPPVQMAIQYVEPYGKSGFVVVDHVDYTKEAVHVQIFGDDGKLRGEGMIPGQKVFSFGRYRIKFMGDTCYTLQKNEDGDFQIVRYRIKLEG